jgi:anti-sigma B factor antagonist
VELARIERAEDPGHVRLIGEIDVSNVEGIESRLAEELELAGSLVIDASELTFIDSQGLRMLIRLGEQATKNGSGVNISNCSEQVRRLLDVSVPRGIPGVELAGNG